MKNYLNTSRAGKHIHNNAYLGDGKVSRALDDLPQLLGEGTNGSVVRVLDNPGSLGDAADGLLSVRQEKHAVLVQNLSMVEPVLDVEDAGVVQDVEGGFVRRHSLVKGGCRGERAL